MGEIRPGVTVQRQRIAETLRDMLAEQNLGELTVEMVAKHAGVSRATFYRCYSSVDEVVMVLYDDFERTTRERLHRILPRSEELGPWVKDLVSEVLRDSLEMGPLLRQLYREELRASSAAAERQQRRIAMQTELISSWWEVTTRLPADQGLIESFILVLQAAGLSLAGSGDEKELERLTDAISFLIVSAIDRYRKDADAAEALGTSAS